MKLSETILFSLAVAFFIIGVHQTFTVGILDSYWIFMLTIGLFLIFKLKRNSTQDKPTQLDNTPVSTNKSLDKNKKRSTRK